MQIAGYEKSVKGHVVGVRNITKRTGFSQTSRAIKSGVNKIEKGCGLAFARGHRFCFVPANIHSNKAINLFERERARCTLRYRVGLRPSCIDRPSLPAPAFRWRGARG